MADDAGKTHFGFEQVDPTDKARRVRGVFDAVAGKYDLMNDLMSMGMHRVWKAYAVTVSQVREGDHVLDIAAGTGDLARAFARQGRPARPVVHTDINESMLRQGRDRLLDEGVRCPVPPMRPGSCRCPMPASTSSASPSACAT
jgi:demethylmenaquinone methyltransferase/2-methoxy-6-polyprenyl-1,4-benzoquinol methylase